MDSLRLRKVKYIGENAVLDKNEVYEIVGVIHYNTDLGDKYILIKLKGVDKYFNYEEFQDFIPDKYEFIGRIDNVQNRDMKYYPGANNLNCNISFSYSSYNPLQINEEGQYYKITLEKIKDADIQS